MKTPPHSSITRAELNEAFRLLKRLCKPRPDEEAVLSYDDTCLHIELGGMTVTPAATGTWSSQIRIPGSYLMGLVKLPPAGNPLVVRVENGRIHFGSSSVACKSQGAWSRAIELPMNPTTAQILTLHHQFSPEEIEASGYTKVLRGSQTLLDRKIEKAAKELEGLEIPPDAFRRFIYAQMKLDQSANHL
jgi:hypothetical protein